LLCCFVAYNAEAYSSGAPTAACYAMKPLHGYDPQPFPAPYNVTATAIDASRYQGMTFIYAILYIVIYYEIKQFIKVFKLKEESCL
jgi:hypothetical protein